MTLQNQPVQKTPPDRASLVGVLTPCVMHSMDDTTESASEKNLLIAQAVVGVLTPCVMHSMGDTTESASGKNPPDRSSLVGVLTRCVMHSVDDTTESASAKASRAPNTR